MAVLDRLRSRLYAALTSPVGDGFLPVRLTKKVALFGNDRLGRPFAPDHELAERLEYARTRHSRHVQPASSPEDVVPVVVFHDERNARDLARIREILHSAGISYDLRNVEEDEAARSAVQRESGGPGFPVVFAAGEPLGGLDRLEDLERRGELRARVMGP